MDTPGRMCVSGGVLFVFNALLSEVNGGLTAVWEPHWTVYDIKGPKETEASFSEPFHHKGETPL